MQKTNKKSWIRSLSSTLIAAMLCGTIGIQTFIFHAPKARAAAISWVGGASGNWGVNGNWSTNSVPTSSDDVTINGTATNIVVNAISNVSFNSLTIGGDATYTSELVLAFDITSGGSITIENNGRLTQKNRNTQTLTGTLTVNSGGILRHEENTTTHEYEVDFQAATITVNSGGSVNVNERGFSGGTGGGDGSGPGPGVNTNVNQKGSGGGHGGAGGDDAGDGTVIDIGGAAYCTATNPATLGSGGGHGGAGGNAPGAGGDGGGLIRLTSTGNITIAGTITANGGAGGEDGAYDGGGGAGGGIYIYGSAITANTATIEAKGGSSGNGNSGGGGGGGCSFFSYTSNAFAGFPHSETGGVGWNNGAAGTYNTEQRTPNISFASASSNGAESANGTITANLSSSIGADATVHYTVTGTATQGTDFTALTGKLTIPSGSTSATINITVSNDTTDEANETVILTIYNPTNATLGATTVHTYTIDDDDSGPTVAFRTAAASDSEGFTAALLPVTLSEASTNNITVDYSVTGGTATGGGTDYTLASGTLLIEAGKTIKNITLTSIDDSRVESDETIIVTLTNPINASLGATTAHTYTLKDNDGTPTVEFSEEFSFIEEGQVPSIGVTISRAPAASFDAEVTYTVTGGTAVSGTNYTLVSPGTLTFNSGSAQNISPATTTDADAINQTLILTLSSPTNANLGARQTHTLYIREATVNSTPPTGLTVQGMPSPSTVTTNNPVFGWKFSPTITHDNQASFQILIATSESNLTGGTYTCDTSRINTNKSALDYTSMCNGTLAAGTYYWKMRTYNSNATASTYSAVQTLTVSSVITPPTACATSSISRSALTLGWADNASNETGYEVEQSLATFSGLSIVSNGAYRRVATTSANAVSYDITGLSPNSLYFFRVRAVNATGTSAYLSCSRVNTLATTPNAPGITPLSTTSFRIVIDPTGNSTMTEYAIKTNTTRYLQADGTEGVGVVYQSQDDWGSRGVTATGLEVNTAYSISIIARDANGATTTESSTTTAYTLADKTIVSTTAPAATALSFSIGLNGNPAGTLVAVQVYDGTQTRYVQSDGSLSHALVRQTPAVWGTLIVPNLKTTTNYRLQAISYNGDGLLTSSFPAAARTEAASPNSFRVTALSDVTATLYVDAQPGYQYLFNSDPGGLQADNTESVGVTNDGSTANHTIKLNNGVDTPIVTMAFCSGVLAPGTPTIDNSATTSTSIKLTLAASSNPASTEYQIHELVTNTYVTSLGTLSPTPTSATRAGFGGDSGITITGLTPGGDYEFRVKGRNCQNVETAASATRIAEIPSPVPLAPTVSITSGSTGVSAARIFIDTTGFSNTALNVIEFAVYDATTHQYVANTQGATSGNGILGAAASWNLYENWGGTNGFIVYNHPANVSRQLAVKARRAINSVQTETAISPKTTITTGVHTSLVSVSSVTASTISLQVNNLNNTTDGIRYLIELISGGASTYLQNGGTNDTFAGAESWAGLSSWEGYDGTADGLITISNLSPNTSYTFRVKARNADSVTGDVSPTTTIYSGVATPTTMEASASGENRINLSWNVASNPAGTEYKITESRTGKYVASNSLTTSETWSTFDNIVPTNTTYVTGLTAGTAYTFSVVGRNAHGTLGTSSGSATATTAAAASSSGGGGGGSAPAPTTPAPTTPAPTEPTPSREPEPTTPTPTTPREPEPTTPLPTTPAPTEPTPSREPEPTTPTPTTLREPREPIVSTPTEPSAPVATNTNNGSTSSSGGGSSGGGGFVNDLSNLQKQREEIDKQIKEQGYITFLDKKVEVPGAKSFVGITRDQFLASLNDVPYEKIHTQKTVQAINEEVASTLRQKEAAENNKFIRTNEAYYAILATLNVTEIEACKLRIFQKCDWSTEQQYLNEKTQTSLFSSARNYLNDLVSKKTRTIDTDKDGLFDYDEIYLYETNQSSADTDKDGLFDGDEIKKHKTDALNIDTDGDGLSDGDEVRKHKTAPLLIDTDNDRWTDKQEIDAGTDPKNPLSHPETREAVSGTKDTDGDGLSDLEERNIGTDANKVDTDGDNASDGNELDRGTNPLVFDSPTKNIETSITNIRSGMKFAESPLVRGSSKANGTVMFYARNEIGLKKEVGRTEASSNNLYAFQLRPLPDGTYYIQAQDDQGSVSKPVKIVVDSTLRIPAPEITKFNNQEISADIIAKAKLDATYQPESNSRPTIEIRIPTGTKGIFTFKSAIGTAVLISDTPSGIVEVRPPEELELGEHEVIAYSLKEEDNTVSPITSFKFNVTDSSSFDSSKFRIKNKDSGGVISFLRQNTVKPLFTKIFAGVSIVLVLWGLLSLYQRRKKE